ADRPCSNRGDCSEGMGGNGTCSLCSCVHGLCDSGLRGDGRCTCFSGYKGPNCDQELPECASLACQHNSRCMEEALTGKLVCQCLPGYQKSGAQCLSKNPCLQRVCHAEASCVHTGPDQHLCACKEGYRGDGRVCMAVDPCQTTRGGCSVESVRCVYDEPGKVRIFPGLGQVQSKSVSYCSLKEFCRPDSCHKNANCTTVGLGRVESVTFFILSVPTECADVSNVHYHAPQVHLSPRLPWERLVCVQKADMVSVLDSPGPITVFAPSSSAFDAMPEGHLSYLSSAEGQILVNGATVLEAAVEANNGRLYVLDGLLTPPSIQPLLPHRCDLTKTEVIQTPACCKGFYGPDCRPCPGGYQTPCSGHGQCFEGTGGNGSCICDSNYRGSRCQYCSSSNKYGANCDRTCPCIHGKCDNRPDSDGSCKMDSCLMGFTGRFCDTQTVACGVQAQFCHAHAYCSFNQGTTSCGCKPGYQGDGITCVESDPCAPPLRGRCNLNAKCIKTGPGTHTCQCLTGWREDGDECQPINNCDGSDGGGCHSNATCIYVGPGQSDCSCKAGYKGNGGDCEAVNQCVSENGGCHFLASCRLLSSQWTCVCDDGYVGDGHRCYGTVAQVSPVPTSACVPAQNITLLVPSSAAVSKMSPEDKTFWTTKGNLPSLIRFQLSGMPIIYEVLFVLLFCKQDVNTTRYHVVVSERLLKTDLQPGGYKQTLLGFSFQLGHGRCAAVRGQRSHRPDLQLVSCLQGPRCCGGFFGQHCEPCPGPKGRPCFGNGACADGTNGTGLCRCGNGFNGTACETCQSGKYGVHCDQDCGCKNGRCDEGLEGDGTCTCDVGWRGLWRCFSSTSCFISSHSCVIRAFVPQCLCAAGFQGNGTFCQATDLCLVGNGGCSLSAVCKRTRPGRRDCVCDVGFFGDGLVCVEINPCLEGNGGCHSNADCVHVGPNKTSCSCSERFSGDGKNCKMINLCQKGNGGCHQYARCNMTGPGVRTCTCIGNFIGDGLTCRGTVGKVRVMDLVNDWMYQPVTIFLPSDGLMASLPQEQKDFLFHRDNRPQLVEYLKYHVLLAKKVIVTGSWLSHAGSPPQHQRISKFKDIFRNITLLSRLYIFVNDGKCRIIQRHLIFNAGIAYGIDCLLTPPSLGGRCDKQTTFNHKLTDRSPLLIVPLGPACPGGAGSVCGNHGKCDDGHLGNGTCTCEPGFRGVACELCSDGFYGDTCTACTCSEHGSCDDGPRGTGSCFCEAGWTGGRSEVSECSPSCSEKAVCHQNNTCVCRPFYEGDGLTCTAMDMCQAWNGGCAPGARCSQEGERVSCSCPKGHSGDGFTCQPMDPCVPGDNGGCHEHATCTMTSPCACKDNYIGDGLSCHVKQLPISRCLQDNGPCHQDATCIDLHFEDARLGVFHLRAGEGQYKLNFTAAQQTCTAEGGTLATYNQLSYAQQGGLNMCAAGWLDQARVAYPTTYSNPQCGFGHIGIVDYGTRKESETWDAFCYRMKEVACECTPGYVGDGFSCTGNLLQVLESTPAFSNFLTVGVTFICTQSKCFMRYLYHHILIIFIFVCSSALSRFINDRFVTDSDILASNGIIHVLQGPLKAPPPLQEARPY
uniref:Stabilin 2 n=1 Tax=Cyclopterus lumpus TaxID=8103 RepID=A0A8C2YY13_CYCLU